MTEQAPSKEQLVDELVLAVRDETRPNLGVSYEHQCREQDRRTARTFQARAALMAAMRAAPEPRADRVDLPQNEAQAELMTKVGMMWLEQNAPHKLRAAQPPPDEQP